MGDISRTKDRRPATARGPSPLVGPSVQYGVVLIDGEPIEVCAECGFDGRRWRQRELVAALRGLSRRWSDILDDDETLLRMRPAADCWCGVEYADHVAQTLALVSHALTAVIDCDLSEITSPPPVAIGPDRGNTIDITNVVGRIAAAADEIASDVAQRSDVALARTVIVDGVEGDMIGLARHALHDAHHHLLDATRNLARRRLGEPSR